jgi:tetratricopeptide (TPR) repeat protein
VGRHEDALTSYREALSLNPQCASTYFQQAKALFALGRPEDSLNALKTAFGLDPGKKEEFRKIYPDLYRDHQVRRMLGLDR